MVNMSDGEDPHYTFRSMKLFSSIAAAAVIGASFLVPNSVEAKKGWIKITQNTSGEGYYIKDVRCGGPICEFDFSFDNGNNKDTGLQVNCNNWTRRLRHVSGDFAGTFRSVPAQPYMGWETISPATVHNAAAEYVCR